VTSTVPTNLGKSQCELIDKAGKAFGKEVCAAAAIEGNITELSYMYPRPGETEQARR
jgi:hypothetical protein